MARMRGKRKRSFSAGAQARLRAREAIGTPPPSRAIPSKKRKPPKHKKDPLDDELDAW